MFALRVKEARTPCDLLLRTNVCKSILANLRKTCTVIEPDKKDSRSYDIDPDKTDLNIKLCNLNDVDCIDVWKHLFIIDDDEHRDMRPCNCQL